MVLLLIIMSNVRFFKGVTIQTKILSVQTENVKKTRTNVRIKKFTVKEKTRSSVSMVNVPQIVKDFDFRVVICLNLFHVQMVDVYNTYTNVLKFYVLSIPHTCALTSHARIKFKTVSNLSPSKLSPMNFRSPNQTKK